MKIYHPKREELNVNLTPLIDVVFLLLIFFMVSTKFKDESKLDIELPKASSTKVMEAHAILDIKIDAHGRYHIRGNQLEPDQRAPLRALLKHWHTHDQGQLIISGDQQAPHQSLVTLLDIAQQEGVQNIQIKTRKF